MARGWLGAACVLAACPTGPRGNDDDALADDDIGDDDAGDDDVGDDDTSAQPATDEPPEPDSLQRSCDVTVRFRPLDPVGNVDIAGEFSGWAPSPMAGPDGNGVYSANLGALAPGTYAYKVLPGGAWEGDPPPWAFSKWVDGTENRAVRVGDCQRPRLRTLAASASADGTLSASIRFERGAAGEPIDPASLTVLRAGAPVDPSDVSVEDDGARIQIVLSDLPPGKHSLLVDAADGAGRSVEGGPAWIPLWVEDEPFDVRDGAVYFAFTDRFRNRDWDWDPPPPWVAEAGVDWLANWQGGDLGGVLDALREDWFEALGVRTLWLSPVLDNPEGAYAARDGVHGFTGFHGYWPIDPLRIEERWGDRDTEADALLREVIAEAHGRGIRVLFDLVLNHVHEDHAYVSAHPEWFGGGCVCGEPGCDWEERARDCWFMPYLPDLDYRNGAVVDLVLPDTLALLRAYDVDAVRVDAAKHMDHTIMRSLRRMLAEVVERGGAAPLWLVGETFTGSDGRPQLMEYVSPWELSGQFDFALYWTLRGVFAASASLRGLEDALAAGEAAWGDAPMSPFVGNHDVMRLATEIAGNPAGAWGGTADRLAAGADEPELRARVAQAVAFVLTLPGVPLIYYGDEIGLAGDGDPDNRRPMTFPPYLSANQEAVLDAVRRAGAARAGSAALRRGDRQQLWVDDTLLVFMRREGADTAIVALHTGASDRAVDVPVPELALEGVTLTDAMASRAATVAGGTLHLELTPHDLWVLLP